MNSIVTALLGASLMITATSTLAANDATGRSNPASATAATSNAQAHDADNTARNKRDRNDATQTPPDQSSNKGDVELTRKIRKALTDDNTLGTNAKNVKIITVNGQVTLRGPVANADERAKVVAAATNMVGANQVKDELEVESH